MPLLILLAVTPAAGPVDWTRREVPPDAKQFWSFRPLADVRPPAVDGVRSPVDAFLAAKMRRAGVTPNPPASERQILRRLHFGLTGLPPTPADAERFYRDTRPGARGRLIGRLLASSAYGERWGRHWLDVARFAESHGFEHDYDRPHAYHYRDFVIEALNRDMPFDRFVRWQIAGDEFAPDEPLALKATGFLAAGVHSTQITKNEAEKHRYDELDDMLATTGTAMLGLTFGCARCHDHKYDPIPQADYYRMLATFTTTVRSHVPAPGGGKMLISSEGLKAVRLHSQGPDFLKLTHFLDRGEVEKKRRAAAPGFLQVLADGDAGRWREAPPADCRTSYRRRSLANWLTDVRYGAGSLLARVIVNRLWAHHFGTGLVDTPSDFGDRGGRPSHPELLDWLAGELVRNGWRLKPIHRLIVGSGAYARSPAGNPPAARRDPNNRLLWRWSVRRLEAESLRDALLMAGGRLDRRMFGRGTLDPMSRRRSVYLTVKRSRPVGALAAFDAPDGTVCVADRPATTVAPQALHLLNDPAVRACAAGLAGRTGGDVSAAFRALFGRGPTPGEASAARAFLASQRRLYRGDEAAARVDLAQALLGLNEFLYVD